MALILPSQLVALEAFGVLLYETPGFTALVQHTAYIDAGGANGVANYKAALNSIFASTSTASLATSMLTNLGLTTVFTQAQGEAYLNANAANRVGAMIDLANMLYNYSGTDATLLAAKTAFATAITSSYNYSIVESNTQGTKITTDVFLTNGTDILSGTTFQANQVYTPGGDNRINSLQDEDQLTGTGANDSLTATLGNANDNGASIITPKLTGIEIINAQFTGSGGTAVTALDLQDSTGQTEVNVTRVSQSVNTAEVGNLMSPASKLSLSNTNANNAGTVEFSYGQDVLKGATTGTLQVSNVQIGTLNIGENTSGIAARGVGINGFETLTLTSAGAATNTIGTLNLPMDTGTDGVLTITGAANLTLGSKVNVVNAGNNALIEAKDVWVAGTGVAQAGGRIKAIDASAMTGNLSIVLDNILDVGKAETSGVQQNVTVTGGKGNDTFVLYDAVQAGDSINGGDGTDTLLFYSGSSLASVAGSIEQATMLADGSTGNISLDFDFLPNATGMTVRNISAIYPATPVNAAEAAVTFSLTDLSVAQAAAITVQHSTTGNGQIANTIIEAAVKANTASDTLGVTIAEGTNTDPRFNFTIDTVVANTTTAPTASASTFENITITDADSESNSVLLQNFAQHTGTIKATGGVAGTYLNFDLDTAGADVTVNKTGADGLAAGVQQGLLGLNTDGLATDLTTGNVVDVAALATEVRLGVATFDASGEASNVIARFGTNAASVNGAQAISTGSGNDVVIFDLLNDNRAGLTISDTVAGGTGSDTLVIDGNAVRISLGASEWTNVSGFETIRLVGDNAVAVGTKIGENSYNLTLTNDLINTNGTAGLIAIVNDNDSNNDTASAVDTVTVAANAESAVTIDARQLDAAHHFSYNGEEGASRTTDKFILSDANVNGMNVIDGGAVDNVVATNSAANADVLEVRNNSVVTTGDLANVKNVGTIAASNDQAVQQTMVLQLNDTVVDSMVDSYHAASTTQVETLNVRVNATADIAAVAGLNLILDASQLTAKTNVSVTLDGGATAVTGDSIQLGFGTTIVDCTVAASFDFVGTGVGAPTADAIVLSAAQFGINVAAVGTKVTATGNNIVYGALGTGAATDRIYVVEGTNITGAAANDVGIYYDSDGSGAGAAVLIGVLVDSAANVISGAANTGLTIIA